MRLSLPCVKVKGGDSEQFRIDNRVKEVKMGMERRGSEIPGGGERVEIAWPLVCR